MVKVFTESKCYFSAGMSLQPTSSDSCKELPTSDDFEEIECDGVTNGEGEYPLCTKCTYKCKGNVLFCRSVLKFITLFMLYVCIVSDCRVLAF